MKYDINLVEKVTESLKELLIDEEVIKKITDVVKLIDRNNIRLPIFNKISFSGVDNSKKNLKVLFNSNFKDIDYTIELIYDVEEIILKDTNGYFYFSFGKGEDFFKLLYGDDVLVFYGNKKMDRNTLYYEKVVFAVYAYTDNLDVNNIWNDFGSDFLADQHHSFNINFSSLSQDGQIHSNELFGLENCIRVMIDYSNWVHKTFIDPFEKTLEKKINNKKTK
jgi:hypothetical protein